MSLKFYIDDEHCCLNVFTDFLHFYAVHIIALVQYETRKYFSTNKTSETFEILASCLLF